MIELAKMPDLSGTTFGLAGNEVERQAYFRIRTAAYAAVPGQPVGRPCSYDEVG